MRMRIIAAAVVLGLGIVGITLAQQGGEPSKPGPDRAKLRAQVAKLRAEIELLQLEHDADVDFLKKGLGDMKNLDSLEAAKEPMKEQAKSILEGPAKKQMEQVKEQLEQLKKPIEALKGEFPNLQVPGLPEPQEEMNNMFLVNDAAAKLLRPIIERQKQEFVRKAAELNEKRLELAEVEKQYNEAR